MIIVVQVHAYINFTLLHITIGARKIKMGKSKR